MFRRCLLFTFLVSCGPSLVSASPILDGWAIAIDNQIFTTFAAPTPYATQSDLMTSGVLGDGSVVTISGNFDAGIIDYQTDGLGQIGGGMGLGNLQVLIEGTGTHTVSLWVDHHIDVGGTLFYYEGGTVVGTAPTGYTYTIDGPYGPDYKDYSGSAYFENATQTLDNINHLGPDAPSDASMAIGISHNIGQASVWLFSVGYSGSDYIQPGFAIPDGFHLTQSNIDADGSLYFSASVSDTPEPSTGFLLGSGAMLLLLARRRVSAGSRAE
jgi:hypothetical protein